MARIAIVTDSIACIPAELIEKYDIHVVPDLVIFGQRAFRDGVDITPKQFYRMLREAETLPTTSVPSIGDFLRVYARLSREAEAIVSIHVPKELSALFTTAQAAARLIDSVPVHVIDSRTVTMAQGFVVLAAARAAAEGQDLAEVARRVEALIPKVNFFFTLETLEYLQKGGRIGRAAALVGSVLKIKPILYINEGRIDVLEKVRTKRRAVERMVELMEEKVGSNPVHAAVLHADTLDEADRLKEEVAARFNCRELHLAEVSPVIGVHTGPGLMGVAFYSERRGDK
ncbi:MAG: DegV family protein [Chloroflexota bacterium]|nr:DegV family protein [Chloroflexota bacterium]